MESESLGIRLDHLHILKAPQIMLIGSQEVIENHELDNFLGFLLVSSFMVLTYFLFGSKCKHIFLEVRDLSTIWVLKMLPQSFSSVSIKSKREKYW